MRMARNSCAWRIWRPLGSHAINGVAALHTELLKTHVLSDFYALTPEKFQQQDEWSDASALDAF